MMIQFFIKQVLELVSLAGHLQTKTYNLFLWFFHGLHQMSIKIIVLADDDSERRNLCELLKDQSYPLESLKTLDDLSKRIAANNVCAVIIDIDSVPVNNRTLRDLSVQHPEIYVFCLSEKRLHPELQDALCHHIYACINKPIDPDEILFWIKSIMKEYES